MGGIMPLFFVYVGVLAMLALAGFLVCLFGPVCERLRWDRFRKRVTEVHVFSAHERNQPAVKRIAKEHPNAKKVSWHHMPALRSDALMRLVQSVSSKHAFVYCDSTLSKRLADGGEGSFSGSVGQVTWSTMAPSAPEISVYNFFDAREWRAL